MHFEDLPTTPRSEELVDKAFSRAARAGRAKQGKEAQESMLQTAGNILSDNLENVVTSWPDFDDVDAFYYELADATLADTDVGGVDELRQALSAVMNAGRRADQLKGEYQGRIRTADTDTARKLREQAFARLADVTEDVSAELLTVGEAREALRTLPDIRSEEPAIVVAGYPNVGKSSFVNRLTSADNETAAYPYTTLFRSPGTRRRRRRLPHRRRRPEPGRGRRADRKSTRLNSSHEIPSRMPSSA